MRLITIQACAHGFGMQRTKEERDDKKEREGNRPQEKSRVDDNKED